MDQWTGTLRLTAENNGSRTAASHVYHQGAYKIARPIYSDDSGQAYYYVMNPGGGYVDGDRYRMSLELGERAQVLMTTQSSTKIYRTPRQPVLQMTDIDMKSGSYLEWLPDPIIGYRDARYRQQTVIHMEKGATLISAEIITPGWSPDGSLFAYEELSLKTEIYLDRELVLYDRLKLRPGRQPMSGLGVMEGHTHYGSLFIIGEQAKTEFVSAMMEVLDVDRSSGKIGVSELVVPGFAVRLLADSTQTVERSFGRIINYVRQQWFGKSPVSLRKY
ncbi:urease accessory protein UreD [Paenibacillus sp. J2TS4]|uniref:urease accessory protein UreD n=1 Tax=Paenibacillus sp. J2TS4 TaxID=2807194 RepID=UPI001B119024|nr:urease accessory protein UreD [Paenibacillus sp. J2TS4]GIP34858.1 urease accessory protein UreD [Paenibacillus sp. J2TS4]